MRIKPKKSEMGSLTQYDTDYDLDDSFDQTELLEDPTYRNLKPSQKRFIYFLYVQQVKGWTNAKTYKVAYRKPPEYPNSMAGVRYINVMQTESVRYCKELVKRAIQKKLERIPERIIEEECNIAFSDIAKYFDSNGHLLLHPSKLPPKVRSTIGTLKAIHQKNGSVVYEVGLWNKGAALGRLQSVFGMAGPQRLELSGPGAGPIKTANANYDFTVLSYDDQRLLRGLLDKCRLDQIEG